MAATLVAVSTSTRRRAAGWASGATCRLWEWRRGGWGRGCSTGVDPLAGNLAVCLYTTGHARVTRWALSTSLAFYVWLKSHYHVFLSVYHEYQKEHGAAQQLRARLVPALCTHKGTHNQPSTAARIVPVFFIYVCCLAHINTLEKCGCSKQACSQMAARVYSRQTAQRAASHVVAKVQLHTCCHPKLVVHNSVQA